MEANKAQQGGGALPTNETARVQAGRIEDRRQGTGAIVGGLETPGKPVSIDVDLPTFHRLQAAAGQDGWQLTRVVAEGAPVYLLRRQRLSEALHDLEALTAFLAARGVCL